MSLRGEIREGGWERMGIWGTGDVLMRNRVFTQRELIPQGYGAGQEEADNKQSDRTRLHKSWMAELAVTSSLHRL